MCQDNTSRGRNREITLRQELKGVVRGRSAQSVTMLARVRCVRRNAWKICSRETSGAGAVRARAAAPAASWYTSWRE